LRPWQWQDSKDKWRKMRVLHFCNKVIKALRLTDN